jgi:hypothetical protein
MYLLNDLEAMFRRSVTQFGPDETGYGSQAKRFKRFHSTFWSTLPCSAALLSGLSCSASSAWTANFGCEAAAPAAAEKVPGPQVDSAWLQTGSPGPSLGPCVPEQCPEPCSDTSYGAQKTACRR